MIAIHVGAFVAVALAFIALERRRPRRSQPLLRSGAGTDLAHVVLSNAAPAALFELGAYAALAALPAAWSLGLMAPQPLWLELAVLLALTELSFYAVHRAMHRVPALWRLHRVHHGIEEMDWLAGYRKHALETVLHVAVPFLPIALLGFSPAAWLILGVIGVVFTGFTHLNLRANLGWLEPLLVTPRYHAWHHAADPAEHGLNLAGKLALFDRLFGTRRPAGAAPWPVRFGLEEPLQPSWWQQQRQAFTPRRHR